jgi:hypothetical protein
MKDRMKRLSHHRSAHLLVALCTVMTSAHAANSASASADQNSKAAYPEPLIGVWMSGIESCRANQTYDSERLMEIEPHFLIGYEQVSKPTQISRVSREPPAWRIESVLDVGPSGVYGEDDPRIFVIVASKLVVLSEQDVSIYIRCE